jgi:sugar phosphate isomerase/epimerase
MASAQNLPFGLGVALHSFTAEYVALKWSFEDLIELADYLGGGVEITGPAHHRGYPHVTIEFERTFKSAVERFGVTPTCYGSYADPFTLPTRNRSPDELFEFIVPQLEGAARLGFPVVRLQFFSHVIAERLLPMAERLNLKMGYELHAPLTFESSTVQGLLEQIERLDSPHLGLIPDCGIFASSVSQGHIGRARAAGVQQDVIQQALALWSDGIDLGPALETLRASGLSEQQVAPVEMFWGSFGRSDPANLVTHRDKIVHMHGKFFTMANGEEPNLRYRDVVSALIEGGYKGWLSSEYEGSADVNSFIACRDQQTMICHYAQDDRSARC